MTVEQLIAELEHLPPHAEVRLAMQPAWPFEYAIGAVTTSLPLPEGDTVYLVEAPQLGYLPGEAAEEIGW
jgi:hypothetical protein